VRAPPAECSRVSGRWPFRAYFVEAEAQRFSAIEARCAELDAERRHLTGERNRLVNKAIVRARQDARPPHIPRGKRRLIYVSPG